MIDRLNFYDVYGYFIPGTVLLALLWLPIGITTGTWPPAELSSTIVALIASYLVGHLIHAWVSEAYPHTKNGRPPSTVMLDDADTLISPQTSPKDH